jgi:hypothetical protein
MMLSGVTYIWVFDPGLCGFMVNGAVGVGTTLLSQQSEAEQRRTFERFFALFVATRKKVTASPESVASSVSGRELSAGESAE